MWRWLTLTVFLTGEFGSTAVSREAKRDDDCTPCLASSPASDATAPPAFGSSAAREPEPLISTDYLKLIWADTSETASAPWRWDGGDWRDLGLIGGGVVLGMAALDKPIRDVAQRNRSTSSDRFFTHIQRFGTKQYGLPVLAGFYAYGEFAGDNESKTVALDGLSASLISALVTSSIKGLVGRTRPSSGRGPHYFAPLQDDYSFPSGHATGAFTFASVIATHYDSIWVDTAAYGIAGLVGIARIQQDAHWATDVVGRTDRRFHRPSSRAVQSEMARRSSGARPNHQQRWSAGAPDLDVLTAEDFLRPVRFHKLANLPRVERPTQFAARICIVQYRHTRAVARFEYRIVVDEYAREIGYTSLREQCERLVAKLAVIALVEDQVHVRIGIGSGVDIIYARPRSAIN